MTAVDGGALGCKPRRRGRRDQPHHRSAVGRDDPADRPAVPAELARSGPSTSRPRRSCPALRCRSCNGRYAHSRGSPARFWPATARLPTGRRQTPGRVAEQRQLRRCRSGSRRPADRRQLSRLRHIARAAAPSTPPAAAARRRARSSPRPRRATMIVGMSGRRRVIRRSALRARDGDIPARAATPWPTRSPPMVSAAVTGIQIRCTHHGGRRSAVERPALRR